MQPDLVGLEFTKGELKRLTGVDPDVVFRPSIFRNKDKRFAFLLNEILVCLALTPIIIGVIYTFIVLPTVGSSSQSAIALLIIIPILVASGRWLWRKKTLPQALSRLLDDVDQYHSAIAAIDLNDQLETAGNTAVRIKDRDLIIQALQLTREDLVRALKTERILRENKNLLATPEMFVNNLRSLQEMQLNNQVSEYGRVLNAALQIGISVEAEMRKLQGLSENEK